MRNCLSLLGILAFCVLPSLLFAGERDDAFGKAWSKFSNGDLNAASQLVEKALDENGLSDHDRSRLLYLKSHIQGKRAETLVLAIATMEDAIALRRADSQFVYTAQLGLAKFYMDEARYSEAAAILEDCQNLGEENQYPLGYVYHLLARAAFRMGNLNDALLYTNSSFYAYKAFGDDSGELDARADMGFYLMLNGYWEAGYAETEKAQAMIADKPVGMSNQIFLVTNMILFERCYQGHDTAYLESMVEHHAKAQNDSALLVELGFVRSYDCTQAQSFASTGRPPIPPLQ